MESASVLIVTSLASLGLKVAVEFAVRAPVTVRALLTVVVPVPEPIERVVVAPAKLRLVALVFSNTGGSRSSSNISAINGKISTGGNISG